MPRRIVDISVALKAGIVSDPPYMLPQITAWRSDKIAGPIGQWNKTIYSGFWNIDQWYCVKAGACG